MLFQTSIFHASCTDVCCRLYVQSFMVCMYMHILYIRVCQSEWIPNLDIVRANGIWIQVTCTRFHHHQCHWQRILRERTGNAPASQPTTGWLRWFTTATTPGHIWNVLFAIDFMLIKFSFQQEHVPSFIIYLPADSHITLT